MSVREEFAKVLDAYHAALDEFVRGDSEPLKALFSTASDVTLGNPFGPFVLGPARAGQTMDRAASNYRDGSATGFDNVATVVTSDLAYVVEVEHFRTKVAGRGDAVPIDLRVTSVFRPEEDGWKVVHRHADPITTPQPVESVIQK
jgi:ketosteroid isomerase-like protein